MTRTALLLASALLLTTTLACSDDDGATPDPSSSSSTGDGGSGAAGGSGGNTSAAGGSAAGGNAAGGNAAGGNAAGGSAAGGGAPEVVYASTFDGDAASWPPPWVEAGGVLDADVVGGRARLVPFLSGYSLARMTLAASETDAEASFRFAFDDVVRQGIGFYVRQNGGYLQQSAPAGQGYAVFVEGFSGQPGIGIWYEDNGLEVKISDAPFALQNGVSYRVRFRVQQLDASSTQLQARIWDDAEAEPNSWQLDIVDSQPQVQGLSGGFAFDAWSINNGNPAADLFIDDVTITRLP